MRNVAMMLRKGQGTPKDPKAAEEMFERAAEAGLPTAQADLADMLLKGEAGPPDPKRALPLLQAAAAANHPIAQYELAQMYETGGLVPKDMDVARNLYAAAASHGMPEAKARLEALGLAQRPFNTFSTRRLRPPSRAQADLRATRLKPGLAPENAEPWVSEKVGIPILGRKFDSSWNARSLSDPGRGQERQRSRNQEGLPQPGQETPS